VRADSPQANDSEMRRIAVPNRGVDTLYGVRDENLRFLESALDVRIRTQGSDLTVEGEEQAEGVVSSLFEQLADLAQDGFVVSSEDVRLAARLLREDGSTRLRDYLLKGAIRGTRKTVVPRSRNQRVYLERIESDDMVFGIGPAGTGKTYLAVAQAVSKLAARAVSRIVLARPAVEAGEKLGFLPGDLQEKVNPYLRPLYDALYDLLDFDKVQRLMERTAIEVAPIAFMRGRTLSDAFVIIDEAQNTTSEQMKMVLTRLGPGSKAVVTGDITQIDLPAGRTSGLVEAIAVLQGVEGISFVYFDERDVVRHRLVQKVIKAYETHASGETQTG
jgi:phosphate starvation-inducible PhoH-like protein